MYTSLIAYTFTQHVKLDSQANSCAFVIIMHMLAAGRNNDPYTEQTSAESYTHRHAALLNQFYRCKIIQIQFSFVRDF